MIQVRMRGIGHTTFIFVVSSLVSWEVSFNVSFTFGHDDVNQL